MERTLLRVNEILKFRGTIVSKKIRTDCQYSVGVIEISNENRSRHFTFPFFFLLFSPSILDTLVPSLFQLLTASPYSLIYFIFLRIFYASFVLFVHCTALVSTIIMQVGQYTLYTSPLRQLSFRLLFSLCLLIFVIFVLLCFFISLNFECIGSFAKWTSIEARALSVPLEMHLLSNLDCSKNELAEKKTLAIKLN